MTMEETLERIKELLDELEEYSARGVPIVVEGAGDEEALRELNMKGPIFQISSSKGTALNFLECLARYERVIVLTDFDRTGEELAKFCIKHLQRLGPRPIVDLREELRALLHKDIKEIQGLAKFLRAQTTREVGRKKPGKFSHK